MTKFISKPSPGKTVKVYKSNNQCDYGEVIRVDTIMNKEMAILRRIPEVPFNKIDHFLDDNRIIFQY